MISPKLVIPLCACAMAITCGTARAGSFQTRFVGVTGTMQMSSTAYGGGPSQAIPTSAFTDTGGNIGFGCGGSSAGTAVYGTVTYNVVWVPATGKTIQQDPAPATFTLGVSVVADADTYSGTWHSQNFAYTYDGFTDISIYNQTTTSGPSYDLTLWNLTYSSSTGLVPIWDTQQATVYSYPHAPFSFNFDVALPADADNNTAAWDQNPYRHPGATWPCYSGGNNGPNTDVDYQIQLSVY